MYDAWNIHALKFLKNILDFTVMLQILFIIMLWEKIYKNPV